MLGIVRILFLAAPVLGLVKTQTVNTEYETRTHYDCAEYGASTQCRGPLPTSTVAAVVHTKITINGVFTTAPVTVVLKPVTKTVKSITTSTLTLTESTTTSIFISTLTINSTTTAITTSTETDTVTSVVTTTETTTTTVPVKAGFTAVQDSTHQQNAVALQKKASSLTDDDKQVAAERRDYAAGGKDKISGAAPVLQFYPEKVLCTKRLETVVAIFTTYFSPTQTITKRGSTVTSTVTSTCTSTLMVLPLASTTITTTVTNNITTTSTQINTSVSTTITTATATTTASYYNACAPKNFLGPKLASGKFVSAFNFISTDWQTKFPGAKTAYDCCAACHSTTDTCFSSMLNYGNCLLYVSKTNAVCSSTFNWATLWWFTGTTENIMSNGPCGITGPSVQT
ncbi:hypothetical protein BX600DRAFT_439617 [Xylariales sp. PMI_506]|nr:hypothetical protein BX600DRAFT_439617 [Xylariales sp. PMI_506]